MITAKEITQLAADLKAEFGGQQANDKLDSQLIRQRHVVDAQADPKRLVKPVGSGYGHLVTKQNYAVLSSRPFVAFHSPRGTLDEHAEMLEGATQGMWKLSGAVLAWLMSVQDVVEVGRGVLWVCHVPQLWRGLDFQQKESESGKEYLDRVDNLKLANWPIVARHVDVRDCWPTFTLKREVDQVVKLGKITVRQAKAAYGLSSEKKDTEKLDVIEYADWTHMVTVLGGKTEAEFAKEPFEHNMGMNPFIFLEAPPVSENDEGIVWEGAVANLRHLIPAMDGMITDVAHNTKRETHSPRVFSLDLEGRRSLSPDSKADADLIPVTPDGDIVLDLKEGVLRLSGSVTSPDIPAAIAMLRSFTQENAVRATLMGILERGDTSGVTYNTGAQLAQKQFDPAIEWLTAAAENVAKHFIAAIVAFSETFKDIKGLEDDKIPIYFVDSAGVSQRKKLGASDVKGWENRLQAKIEMGIPLNESSQIMTARLAADENMGVMSLATAMERFGHIANPLEEIRRRALDKIRRALVAQRVQAAQQVGFDIASQPANADILAQDFAALPPSVQQGVQMAAQQKGLGVPEARGEANRMRTGRGQSRSQAEATRAKLPESVQS